jgi:acetoin:2,6-dichlorophenolindophenol oxidoreductase subunit alpha
VTARLDIWSLYALMLRSRLFEEAVARLWHEGRISGEMHLGTGEEAIVAGVVAHLREDDAMALDHRGTAALLMRGVDPLPLLLELLGSPGGLCGGRGGHMHLYSREHLAASSGIVGAAGPTAAGFALAAEYLRPGTVAVAFFGEGAMNQGMLMESLNLASAWKLPVLFVCKDDGWSITTRSVAVTGGDLEERARGLGVPAVTVDGRDIAAVWEAAGSAIDRVRAGDGPVFLRCRCVHLEAHFLGLQLLRVVRAPLRELPRVAVPLTRSFLRPGGATLRGRLAGLSVVGGALGSTARDPRRDPANDPLGRARVVLQREDPARLQRLEDSVAAETRRVVESALVEAGL